MKRILCILLSALLLLSAAGCYSYDPENPDQPSYPTEPGVTEPDPVDPAVKDTPLTPDDLIGTYRSEEDDNHYIQIRWWNGCFTIEHFDRDDYGVWIWFEEFWPDDDGWSTEPGQPVVGLFQLVSMVTGGMIFDDRPLNYAIALTEDGVVITRDDTGTRYVRDENFPGIHTSSEELIVQLEQEVSGLNQDTLTGTWYNWDGETFEFLELAEDGYCLYVRKPVNRAMSIYEGAWGVNGQQLVLMVEVLGASDYAYQANLTWEYDSEYDDLMLYEDGRFLFGEFAFSCLSPYDPAMELYFTQKEAMGYVDNMFDEWSYTDDGEIDMDGYFYQIPRVMGYTQTISELNQEIYYDFGTLAEQGMFDYAADKTPECPHIYYDIYWDGPVITLMVHSYGDDTEMHKGYYYDTLTDTRLYPEDMLDMWGLSKEAYMENLRAKAEEVFMSYFYDLDDSQMQALGYEESRAWTLSDDNLNLYRSLYRDFDGAIVTYVQMDRAGHGYWELLRWETDQSVG